MIFDLNVRPTPKPSQHLIYFISMICWSTDTQFHTCTSTSTGAAALQSNEEDLFCPSKPKTDVSLFVQDVRLKKSIDLDRVRLICSGQS